MPCTSPSISHRHSPPILMGLRSRDSWPNHERCLTLTQSLLESIRPTLVTLLPAPGGMGLGAVGRLEGTSVGQRWPAPPHRGLAGDRPPPGPLFPATKPRGRRRCPGSCAPSASAASKYMPRSTTAGGLPPVESKTLNI